MDEKYTVDGFEFYTKEDARLANEELAKVNALHEKMDTNNVAALKAVYQKAIEQNVFETPIGLTYLNNIRNYLISQGVLKENESPLPVKYTKSFLTKQQQKISSEYEVLKERIRQDAEKKILAQKEEILHAKAVCRSRTILCAVLFLMVVVMFVISLTGKNPTILNYKTAITNQYAEWEEQLSEREKVIREKEAQLEIDNSQK